MSSDSMLRERKIEKIKADRALVEKTFSLAERDIKTAENNIRNEDYDWALAVAYNSMLQAGRALIYSKGFRTIGAYRHIGVIEFVHEEFGRRITDDMIFMFNKLRKKRHRVVYDVADLTGREEAENALKTAKGFVAIVHEILKIPDT